MDATHGYKMQRSYRAIKSKPHQIQNSPEGARRSQRGATSHVVVDIGNKPVPGVTMGATHGYQNATLLQSY